MILLSLFLQRKGEAPRQTTYIDETGCSLSKKKRWHKHSRYFTYWLCFVDIFANDFPHLFRVVMSLTNNDYFMVRYKQLE